MENLRKRVDVKLVRAHEEDRLRRLLASPSFARANIFDDDLAAIEVHKSRLVLNRPVYVGMSILDLSKTLMYDFYYGQLKKQYGDRCQLLYTDTDSLLLEIQTEDVYRDMGKHAELYDTSDYSREHPLHSAENKKSCREDDGRMCRAPNRGIHRLAPQDVQHPRGQRGQHEKSQGREKVRREETHKTQSIQGGSLRENYLPPQHECPAIRAPPYLCATPPQGIAVSLRLQAVDRRKRGGNSCLWA